MRKKRIYIYLLVCQFIQISVRNFNVFDKFGAKFEKDNIPPPKKQLLLIFLFVCWLVLWHINPRRSLNAVVTKQKVTEWENNQKRVLEINLAPPMRGQSLQSDGEVPVMLELWGMQCAPFIVIAPRFTLARNGSTW